jgi:ribosomal protein L7Ae-like RNA K-turn-binding protein
MDKALNYLSLARKAGKLELGEEPAGAAARAQHARLVVVAQNASDHTWRRAKSFVAGTTQECVRLPYTKDELGAAVGRQELAIAALTDPAMALAFLKALPQPEKYAEAMAALDKRSQRIAQRRREEKAHERNRKMGKK